MHAKNPKSLLCFAGTALFGYELVRLFGWGDYPFLLGPRIYDNFQFYMTVLILCVAAASFFGLGVASATGSRKRGIIAAVASAPIIGIGSFIVALFGAL